ncbi:hypothetical protein OAG80_04735, partial [Akkermansiaceae bacterium]|nr:hypothetical protein [Akkermansiaceae bacterium]
KKRRTVAGCDYPPRKEEVSLSAAANQASKRSKQNKHCASWLGDNHHSQTSFKEIGLAAISERKGINEAGILHIG